MGKLKERIKNKFKGLTFKSYLKQTMEFFNNNLKKPVVILFIISILIVVMNTQLVRSSIKEGTYNLEEFGKETFLNTYVSNVEVIGIIIIAGIAPYLYVSVAGSILVALSEATNFIYVLSNYGYLKGILLYIVPMLLNILIIAIASALGIYICKTVTISYRKSNMKHMNFTNFMLQLYDVTKNEKKKIELEKKKQNKMKLLESKYKKIDYFQVINITVILFVFELIASLLKVIVI